MLWCKEQEQEEVLEQKCGISQGDLLWPTVTGVQQAWQHLAIIWMQTSSIGYLNKAWVPLYEHRSTLILAWISTVKSLI